MNSQHTFWALVKHDVKLRKDKNRISGPWRIAYAVTGLIVLVALTTLEGHRVTFDLSYVWYFTFGLPFMVFGLSISRIVQEWRNATAGWWLSLPMSRLKLVTSKFVASLIHTIKILVRIYCVVAILGLYTMLLNGTLTPHAAIFYLETGIKWNILLFCVCPFVSAFGMLFGAIKMSVIKQAMPILWIVFGGVWWLVFSRDGHFLHVSQTNSGALFTMAPSLVYPVLGSWILAYLLVRLAAYVLDRYVAI